MIARSQSEFLQDLDSKPTLLSCPCCQLKAYQMPCPVAPSNVPCLCGTLSHYFWFPVSVKSWPIANVTPKSDGWRIAHGGLLHRKSIVDPSGWTAEKWAKVASAMKRVFCCPSTGKRTAEGQQNRQPTSRAQRETVHTRRDHIRHSREQPSRNLSRRTSTYVRRNLWIRPIRWIHYVRDRHVRCATNCSKESRKQRRCKFVRGFGAPMGMGCVSSSYEGSSFKKLQSLGGWWHWRCRRAAQLQRNQEPWWRRSIVICCQQEQVVDYNGGQGAGRERVKQDDRRGS